MRDVMRCVAEAVLENGIKGLLDMVPGGNFAYAVSTSAWKKYCDLRRHKQLRDDIRELAEAEFAEAKLMAAQVRAEVAALVPAGGGSGGPSEEELITLELYLSAIPEAVRQSLKRADDPKGTTVPYDYVIKDGDDFLRLLPTRPPKFREGDAVPGKAGWVLASLLGIGGFGEVWLAKHKTMSSLFGAVKFCLGQTGKDLVHEAELINRVMQAGPHPNIVPLKDAHLDGDAPWLLFEYVPGGSLIDWIHEHANLRAEERLPKVLAVLTELTTAVAFFHALPRPIVHRDLKPSNILYDRAAGRLRITDFGIGAVAAKEANRLESRGQSTRGGRLQSYLRGSHTPLYSSPQQRRGDDPDPRDDVHALGVIAYQLLTGKLDSAPGTGAVRVLKELAIPNDLSELIQNCVSEEPVHRPSHAVELLRLLKATRNEPFVELKTVTKPPPAPPPPPVARPVAPAPVQRKPIDPPRRPEVRKEVPPPAKPKGGLRPLVVVCLIIAGLLGVSCLILSMSANRSRSEPSEPKLFANDPIQTPEKPLPITEYPPGTVPQNPKIGDVITNKVGIKFAWVPPGESWLGGGGGKPGERKYTQLNGFWAGVYEVTQGQYETITPQSNTPSRFIDNPRMPTVSVSWNQVTTDFLPKLNQWCQGDGFVYRLPSEDEWEYMCRGGPITKDQSAFDFYLGRTPSNNLSITQANFDRTLDATKVMTTEVGKYLPNPLGLYDLHGNVWEWTSTADGPSRVNLGGSWSSDAGNCRAANRIRAIPTSRFGDLGFRLVRVPSGPVK